MTDAEKITVLAQGNATNNTGEHLKDLENLTDVVQLTSKEGQSNTNQNVAATFENAVGVHLEVEATDLFDGASAVVGEDGSLQDVQTTGSDNIYGIAEMAALGLHVWRNEMDDVNARLGDLRNAGEAANGLWARVYSGKADFGSKNITNEYTALQFGYDHAVASDTYVGGAVSYTDGDNDFHAGGGDSSLLAFTAYGTKFWESGLYVDLSGKVGRMKNDFSIRLPNEKSKGEYHTNAVALSGELGWRLKPMGNVLYVEPQVAFMYGHVMGEDYTTSTGVNVKHEGADTLVGRAGFALGLECPNNRGNVYVRASVLHDWMGEADFDFTKGDQKRSLTEDLGGTWYEYGLGANLRFSERAYGYADVEAASGGVVDTDYRVNVGVRWSY